MLRWYGVHYNRKGTVKAIKKLIYVCPLKKLVRRIRHVGVYLSAKRVSVKRQSQSLTVRWIFRWNTWTHPCIVQTECQVNIVKVGIKRLAEETEETTANTRHWAPKYLWWSFSKPTIARDTSQKYPPFFSRQKHATYTSSKRRHSWSATGVSYHDKWRSLFDVW